MCQNSYNYQFPFLQSSFFPGLIKIMFTISYLISYFFILFRSRMLRQLRWKMLLICFATLSKWYLSLNMLNFLFFHGLLNFTFKAPSFICEFYFQGTHPVDGQPIVIKISKAGFTVWHRCDIAPVPKVWLWSWSSTMKQ